VQRNYRTVVRRGEGGGVEKKKGRGDFLI